MIGQLVARALEGCWREQPLECLLTKGELAQAAPGLLAGSAGGLAWRKVRDSSAAHSPAGEQLREAYRRHSLQAALHFEEIDQVFRLLSDEGIDALLIKGWSVARLYPEIGLRPYGDLDLVFRPRQFSLACELLSKLDRRRFNIDPHEGASRFDAVSTEELFERSIKVTAGSIEVRILCPEDHLRILCTHALRHGMWRPVWLCDIAASVETRHSGFDWGLCLGDGPRVADWVMCAIALAGRLLGARIEETPAAARMATLPDWFLSQVLKSWSRSNHPLLAPLGSYAGRPAGLLNLRRLPASLKDRWPDPIRASIGLGMPLNGLPRLPIQLGYVISRAAEIVRELPKSLARRGTAPDS
ncbi:MAG TPA: nucleotidyltransferase family protein, partial [Blastocatellia bacterium]|nr:nucleotidyltransferase family protein [Blastocatellia bacterium]